MAKTAVLVAWLIAVLTVTACSGPNAQRPSVPPSEEPDRSNQQGYLARYSNGVEFVQWANSDGSLTGQRQLLYAPEEDPLQIRSENMSFTGTLSDSEVSLTFSELGFSSTWTGTLEGDTLTLTVPEQDGTLATRELYAATVEDYNQAAQEFRRSVEQQAAEQAAAERTAAQQQYSAEQRAAEIEAQQKAVEEADKGLAAALNGLESDTKILEDDIQVLNDELGLLAEELSTMQENYQRLQQAANTSPIDCFAVQSEDYADYDLDIIRGDLDYFFTQVEETVRSDVARTEESIESAREALSNLQAAVDASESGGAGPQVGAEDVDAAASEAREQIAATEAALDGAHKQAEALGQRAEQIHQDAKALVANAGC